MNGMRFSNFLVLWNNLQKQGTPDVHVRLADWLEARWRGGDRNLLVMAFRGFGKSTILGVFCTWLLWRTPEMRVLVLAADLALARKLVRNVRRIIEKHPMTKDLIPDRADQWGGDRFTLKRKTELRDPTMLAKGITTNLTGTRADLIICDDVEVPRTSDTAGKREDLRERLQELDFILTPEGTCLYVGTPHHWDTIYAETKRVGAEDIFLNGFQRITIPVLNEAGESAWPEKFTLEKIEDKRVKAGPSHFASQMMCEPVNLADGRFDTERLQVYDEDIVYNEAGQEAVLTIGPHRMVSAVAWWDPSFGRDTGDKSIVAILYTDEHGQYWLHHLQALCIKPDSAVPVAHQQCEKVAEILEAYFIPHIAVEMNGIGQFLPGILRKALGEKGVNCAVQEVTSRKAKNVRIMEGFETVMAAHALHVHRTALKNSFLQEMQGWNPHKKNQDDDTLDAVAGAIGLGAVRIKRSFSTGKKQVWMGNAKVRIAKTVLD